MTSTGIAKFSEVTAFLKKQQDTTSLYKSIQTNLSTIRLTGKHLIYSRKPDMDKFNPMYVNYFSDTCSMNDRAIDYIVVADLQIKI